jgi:methionyl-tRNA formyltransferase
MNIILMAGKQAGCIGLLALLADGHKILKVVAYDYIVDGLAKFLIIPTVLSIRDLDDATCAESDCLVCVHGREIVNADMRAKFNNRCFNVHPCLSQYKGADPINRLLEDKKTLASVGVHVMTDKVDEGEVLEEQFVNVGHCNTVQEVYNELYPLYVKVLLSALRRLK